MCSREVIGHRDGLRLGLDAGFSEWLRSYRGHWSPRTRQDANQINANLNSRRIRVRQTHREILLQQRRDSLADR
jgi:hypothetical protein